MVLECRQPLQSAYKSERTVGRGRAVRKATRPIPANSAAAKTVQAEVDVLVEKGPSRIGAEAATVLRGIKRSQAIGTGHGAAAAKCGSAGHFAARVDSIAKAVIDTEHFVVSKPWFEYSLGNEVRSRIERIVGQVGGSARGAGARTGVVQSTARSLRTDGKIVPVVAACNRRLRILRCDREPHLIAKVLGPAQPVLPCPGETHGILGIDRHRRSFAAIVHAVLGLG